jgi:hypothetical protein
MPAALMIATTSRSQPSKMQQSQWHLLAASESIVVKVICPLCSGG